MTVAITVSALPISATSADLIPTETFFRQSQYETVKLSPTGKYLAVTLPVANQTRLGVIDLKSMIPSALFSVTGQHHANTFFWVGGDRVVFNTVKKVGSLDFPITHDEWFAGNANQTEFYSIGAPGQVLGRDRSTPGRLLVLDGDVYSMLTANILKRFRLLSETRLKRDGTVWLDSANRARVALTYPESVLRNVRVMARSKEASSWSDVRTIRDPFKEVFRPLGVAPDDTWVYVASNQDAPTIGLMRWLPETGETELVFRHSDVDIGGLVYARDEVTPIGVAFTDDRPRVHYFDPNHPDARLRRSIDAQFPGQTTEFTSYSDDGKQAIVVVSSDTNPGEFYHLDTTARTMKPLLGRADWIPPDRMSPMQPIALSARDGKRLHGYLTVPLGAKPERLPTIVLVHGGPHARDVWGFNREVQFLANRGYAVLQVNFRGSSGYGVDFERASDGRWGMEPLDDVIDATKWAIKDGIADSARICIFGASYGGYSALMAVVREPDLYRCAAGYAGVYDLPAIKYRGDVANYTYWGYEYWLRELGTDRKLTNKNSPVNNAGQIRVPIFLAHGREDVRAFYTQFHNMKDALEDADVPVESLFKDKEGHGFYDPKNVVELYNRLAAFFDKHTAVKPEHAAK